MFWSTGERSASSRRSPLALTVIQTSTWLPAPIWPPTDCRGAERDDDRALVGASCWVRGRDAGPKSAAVNCWPGEMSAIATLPDSVAGSTKAPVSTWLLGDVRGL